MSWLAFLGGLVIGACLGVVLAAMLIVASDEQKNRGP